MYAVGSQTVYWMLVGAKFWKVAVGSTNTTSIIAIMLNETNELTGRVSFSSGTIRTTSTGNG